MSDGFLQSFKCEEIKVRKCVLTIDCQQTFRSYDNQLSPGQKVCCQPATLFSSNAVELYLCKTNVFVAILELACLSVFLSLCLSVYKILVPVKALAGILLPVVAFIVTALIDPGIMINIEEL